MTDAAPPLYLTRPDGTRLAYRYHRGEAAAPHLLWLGGFKSDMSGTKATALADYARARGFSYLRFDYSGHGASDGAFADGRVSTWLADSLAVADRLTAGDLIAVGSSMGGWIALHLARARPERVKALVLIAPAADFTHRLMWPQFPADMRARLAAGETAFIPDRYGTEPTPISAAFLEDGRRMGLLDAPIPFRGPVRILQGMADEDVPWRHALDTAQAIASPDVVVTLVKDGDHRLSREEDLTRLFMAIDEAAEAL